MDQNELIAEMKKLLAIACEDIASLLQGSPVTVKTCEKCGMLSLCNEDAREGHVCTAKICKWKFEKRAKELINAEITVTETKAEPKKLQDYEQLDFEF